MRWIPCLSLALAAVLPAQTDVLVLTDLQTGNPRAQLLMVDSNAGAWQTAPRFTHDNLAPLAIAVDGYDGGVVMALANSNTTSIVVRLQLAGTAVLHERTLGQLPGRCSHLEIADDSVLATATGTAGGLYRLPRLGGSAVQLVREPNAAALATWGPTSTVVAMAWSASPTAPQNGPGFGYFDLLTSSWTLGPWTEPTLGTRTVTGIADLPTALVRQAVAFADGGYELVVYGGPPPTPIATIPAIPNGGAAAMKPSSPGSFDVRAVGGAAFPHLYLLDVWGMMPNVRLLAGPLPGDPVDLAMLPLPAASMLLFGPSCGQPPPHLNSRAWPTLGNLQFVVDLSGGAPQQPTLFALGFSDVVAFGGLPLPFALPSGCELRVAPDVLVFHLSDAAGGARQLLPIPNLPGLLGLHVFGQWLQAAALPFATSEATALRLGN